MEGNMDVWSVRDPTDPDRKSFWTRIGRAFFNRDGSINVLLDALPLGRKLQLREAKPKEERTPSQPEPEGVTQ